jgi:gamma-glutamyltranspeptidase / glutathione hydrolase
MKILRQLLIWIILFSLAPGLQLLCFSRSPARGRRGMVASQSELASQIGVDILKRGGNAIDAAVAVAFALAAAYPEAGNLGGGGFMLIRLADGRSTAVDYRETAPASAGRNVFVGPGGNLIKGEGSTTVGYRAAGIPGTPAGLEYAFKKYGSGKVKWADVVEPARLLAERGFSLSGRVAALLKSNPHLAAYPESRRIFQNSGKFYSEGDMLLQPDLARTLARIEKLGAADFYTGETARLIAADMKVNGGLITGSDLAGYRPVERKPIEGTYRGHKIITMPPPSSGGIVLLQILNMLENFDVAAMGWASSAKYHVLAEAMRRAFADRAEWMGDPDFSSVPVSALISKKYARERAATIDTAKASTSKLIGPGRPPVGEGTETTHFTVVDESGNTVSNTFTLNDYFGSAVAAKGTGVLLNDEMDDFAAKPGQPNLFGLVQGERNAVEPFKRPLSSMTPVIVLRKDGSLWFAAGARGGPRITSAVLQIIINMIDHDMDFQQAFDAPRIHHQWMPDEIGYEPFGMSVDTKLALSRLGHKFIEAPSPVAAATGIAVEEKTGVKLGMVDSRSDGAAVGY